MDEEKPNGPMKRVAQTLKKFPIDILNVFISRVIHAICGGINNMLQAAKRKARVYQTLKGFASMIYLFADELQLAFPNPFGFLWSKALSLAGVAFLKKLCYTDNATFELLFNNSIRVYSSAGYNV